MENKNAKLRKALRLQHVPRWGIIPTIRKQTVAEHSHGVAAIALWLAQLTDNPMAPTDGILIHAIEHDEWESAIGDIPSVAKRRGLVEDKTPEEYVPPTVKGIIKLADYLEALIFLNHEIKMGNKAVDVVFDHLYVAAEQFYHSLDWLPAFTGCGNFFSLWKRIAAETELNLHPGMRDE